MSLSRVVLNSDLDEVEPDELARRALAGCADSFADLARHFRPRLVQVLRPRLGGRWTDAEDIAQDTLARAFEQLARFDPRYRFSTWLYTIAFRLATDHLRRQRRTRQHVDCAAAVNHLCDHRTVPAIDQVEMVHNIWSTARERLAPNQFTALWLRFGEDLALPEIAHIMGKTQVSVRVLLHRARTHLIQIMNDTSGNRP